MATAATIAAAPAPAKASTARSRRARGRGGRRPRASTRMSPTFRRVMKVEDIPARSRSEELGEVEARARRPRSARRPSRGRAGSQCLRSCPGAGRSAEGSPSRSTRSRPGALAVRIRVHDELGAGAERFVGDGVHVADDQVGRVAGLEQPVGAAVHADEDRLELADVRPRRSRRSRLASGARATTSAWRSRKRVRSCGSCTPSERSADSSRRWRSVFSAKVSSASVTRPRWSSSAVRELVRRRRCGRRPAACRCGRGSTPRTTSDSPSFTSSKSSAPGRRSGGPRRGRARAGPSSGKRPVTEGETLKTTRTPLSRSSSAETRSMSGGR